MTLKKYSVFPKTPEVKLHHLMESNVISRTLVVGEGSYALSSNAIAMKACSAFPKALASLEPQHQLFRVISRTLVGGVSYPSAEVQSVYSTAPGDWAIHILKCRLCGTSELRQVVIVTSTCYCLIIFSPICLIMNMVWTSAYHAFAVKYYLRLVNF